MSDYFIIHLSTTIVIILATFVLANVCIRKRELFSWLLAYIAASLSEIFRLFSQVRYDTLELVSIIFSALAVLIFIIAVANEYYHIFQKKKLLKKRNLLLFANGQIIANLELQLLIALFLFTALFLSIRIYFRKKTPTHAFMSFILMTGVLQLIASIVRDLGFPGGDEFLEFSRIVMATMMLITGVIAIIEDKIVRSESKYRLSYNRAEFYKDLFVHDINNILQNLQFSLEIISHNLEGYEKKGDLDELMNIAVNQVKRGAELGQNVKMLSDLERGVIKSVPIKLYEILKQIINEMKARNHEEQIKIEMIGKREEIFISANILLANVFQIILNNSVRYNNNSIKEIKIKISKDNKDISSNIKIEFIDNGVGIPDSMKKTLFQPIYEKPKDFKRIGLGLLLVNEVIKSISGKIWIEDRIPGDHTKGTIIIISIPEAH
ncbi:MAG: sensor histidine kinase [Candidatus Odinarchaeota archaeon]